MVTDRRASALSGPFPRRVAEGKGKTGLIGGDRGQVGEGTVLRRRAGPRIVALRGNPRAVRKPGNGAESRGREPGVGDGRARDGHASARC
ncbi:hypothetical protein GCM10018782_20440 [Streptomyces griseoaurantiacus]|nr:hypothetical protein GCM10018782_20440 [Streptomyces griseoaurantiacus]